MDRILVTGIDRIDENKFTKCINTEYDTMTVLNKPSGCLYGSTYTPDDEYPSDWLRWAISEDYCTSKYNVGVSFELKNDARICNIKNKESYLNLISKYNYKFKYSTPMLIDKLYIDFFNLSNDFDAFHLSEDAFWSMRMPWKPIEMELNNKTYDLANFYSYDCETWILFNLDCINKETIKSHTFDFSKYNR